MPSADAVTNNQRDDAHSLRRMGALLRPYTGRLLLAVGMLIGLAMVNMAMFAIIAVLFNKVFKNQDWSLLWMILGAVLAIYILRNLLYFGSKYTSVSVGEHLCFTLRKRLFENLQSQTLKFYKDNQPGRVSSRLMNDSFVIQSFIQDELPTLLLAVFQFLYAVAIIYAVNWQLALASTIVLPLHLIAFYKFRRRIKDASKASAEQLAIVHGNLIEKFLGIEVVKGFTAEGRENAAFVEAIDRSRENELRSKTYHVTQKIVADLIVGVGMIFLLGFGAFQVMRKDNPMQPGTFIAFFGYVGMLYPTVLDIISGFAKLTRATASMDRVYEMLDSNQAEGAQGGTPHKPIAGRLKFESVCFSYSEESPVLKNISFEVPPGKVCAIVGPSGAGKSTTVSLVPRLIEPDLGRVLLDGLDVRDIELSHLREAIGIAFQECFLFNTTVLENLRYAQPNASMKQIVEVAQHTGAHSFIAKLPNGYDTILGENGVDLSRGEKQRITLTRAMLKNPKILILDEATASIDVQSESQIVPAILEFMRGKTTLMITHRPELLQHADIVVQLEDGQVVYSGPARQSNAAADNMDHRDDPARKPRNDGSPGGGPLGKMLSLLFAAAVLACMVANPANAQNGAGGAPAVVEAKADKPYGAFIPLPGLNAVEVRDLVDVVTSHAQAELGYVVDPVATAAETIEAPRGVRGLVTLSYTDNAGMHLVQLGYQQFRSQPIHLWVYGQISHEQGAATANADVDKFKALFAAAQKARDEAAESMTVEDLAIEPLVLSYIEPEYAMGLLRTLGYQTIEFQTSGKSVGQAEMIKATEEVDAKKLPAVVAMPRSSAVNLVGGQTVQGGSFGLVMTPSVASNLTEQTTSAPLMKLMVLYNPARPEQLGELRSRLEQYIDVASRQILLEAMVLEISETGLEKLGVQWQLESPADNLESLMLGRLPRLNANNDELPTVDASITDVFGEFKVRVQALIRTGDAEILSRPSVVTLDNRQASIRVGEEIPVATSATGLQGGNTIAFNFQYIPIGILMNVRPRISADDENISIQIDAIVSAEVPGQDLVVRDQSGDEVARAPRISTRRVQTYSMIPNNTPLIIGGLVAKDRTGQVDKVPFLGDIPLLGLLFKTTQKTQLKREVIIVLTPYVLPDNRVAGRTMPKDADEFDSFGNRLFRDAHRIRAEDVFDLNFLLHNPQLTDAKAFIRQLLRENPNLAEQYPFSSFAGDRIPGEHILVYRQMYEVINRREIDKQIGADKIIFFKPDEMKGGNLDVAFLSPYMVDLLKVKKRKKDSDGFDEVFAELAKRKQAVAFTYTLRPQGDVYDIFAQPVPEVKLLDCPDRATWSTLLWTLNQPDDAGHERHTILIQGPKDLQRLRRAMVLKPTIRLNAGDTLPSMKNFSLGRLLLMPELDPTETYLVDQDTAQLFFLTEHYYPALQKKIQQDGSALRQTSEAQDRWDRMIEEGAVPPEDRMIKAD